MSDQIQVENAMSLGKRSAAEFIGTFWLVLGGCGSAVLAAAFPDVGIGLLGVALAFGLTVLTMAYAIGHISGCHLNPAVSVGLCAGGRFKAAELPAYVLAQVLGAVVAAGVLYFIANGKEGFDLSAGLRRPTATASIRRASYSMAAGFVTEVVMTMMFLLIILGSTDKRAPAGFAPIAIGLGLTLIHLDQHPGDEHVGEPRAQHRPGAHRRRLGDRATVDVLGRADSGRRDCGLRLSLVRDGLAVGARLAGICDCWITRELPESSGPHDDRRCSDHGGSVRERR